MITDPYLDFLARKAVRAPERGMRRIPSLNAALRGDQAEVTAFLLRIGSGAAFLDTGLGKTFIALEWGRCVVEHANKPVLMLAPLAVAPQHAKEAARFGIKAKVCRSQTDVEADAINLANYERLHLFDPAAFGGVVLDESSIVKSFTGVTTRKLMSAFAATPFRLCCTATPAPNDHMELGQHSQFLGVMPSNEMLARWFIADQSEMGRYRLKRHGVRPFWSWVASWARCMSRPSDLGYPDDGFDLPPLDLIKHEVRSDLTIDAGDALFRTVEMSATSMHKEKRLTTDARADLIADLVAAEPGEPWIIWCDTDYEADALTARIAEAVEVRGSMPVERKEEGLVAFTEGRCRVLVTKPSIAGHGLNWQHCARMAFVGLSFSYERFYQAIRRCWRYGQTRPVKVHVAMADTESALWQNVSRKADDHAGMKAQMVAAMRRESESRLVKLNYQPTIRAQLPAWLKGAA